MQDVSSSLSSAAPTAAAVKPELDFKVDDVVEAWDVKKEIYGTARRFSAFQ